MAQINISDWKADHLRISFFSDKSWDAAADEIFPVIFGLDPLETSRKIASGESNATGVIPEGKITVARTINRVDIVLQASAVEGEINPMLANVDVALKRLKSSVAKWALLQHQAIVRLAISGRVLLPTVNVSDSYLKLKELIQVVQIDAERFRDFQFQVNLVKKSNVVSDLLINRISVWAAIRTGAIMFANGALSVPEIEQHFCTCNIDVNTDGSSLKTFNKSEIESLLDEAYDEMVEIIKVGIY